MALERILIVEDDIYFASLIKEKLLKIKSVTEVDIFEGGVEFFKQFMRKEYSLVILDYKLKDIDGLQILLEIKDKKIDMPVVILTGQGDESVAVDCFLNGAIDYIIKDFHSTKEIIERIVADHSRFKEQRMEKIELQELRKETELSNDKVIQLTNEIKELKNTKSKISKELKILKEGEKKKESFYKSLNNTFTNKLDKIGGRISGHTKRVVALSLKVAKEMQMNDDEIIIVYATALLHDIGGQNIDDVNLLFKSEASDEEQMKVKKLSEEASEIIANEKQLNEVARNVLYKYERWDGKGHPYGLKKDEIPMPTRIVQMIDAFDILTGKELGKKRLTPKDALAYLKEKSGELYDPTVIVAFEKILSGK
jgi:response regulator RpfG family c-di-GMP phosphodiesterase